MNVRTQIMTTEIGFFKKLWHFIKYGRVPHLVIPLQKSCKVQLIAENGSQVINGEHLGNGLYEFKNVQDGFYKVFAEGSVLKEPFFICDYKE